MRRRQLGCVIVLAVLLVGGTGATVTPAHPITVGVRDIGLSRGADRPLRTVVWYPARGKGTADPERGAPPAQGRYPLVLFSHGLTSYPEAYQAVTVRLARAGFIVAAPAYPHTSRGVARYDPHDIANQPADASAVITAVLALDTTPGDPLAGHIDTGRVAAGGHSAGGYTTAGLLSGSDRDLRLRAGVIISGGVMDWLDESFTGPATPVLFIHGRHDRVVSYAKSRTAYDELGWPKAYLTLWDGDHVSPVSAATDGDVTVRTMINFLRWALYGDADAGTRMASEATVANTATFDSVLIMDRIR